jgi:hypothetical protein
MSKMDKLLVLLTILLITTSISSKSEENQENENSVQIDKGVDKKKKTEEKPNYYKERVNRKKKEIEEEEKKNKKKDGDSDEEDGDQDFFDKNKEKILNIVGVITLTFVVLLIGWKMYNLSKSIKKQQESIKAYSKQMENIIDDTDNLVFVSWKDQKEGILFLDNCAYKKKQEGDLSKAQQLQREIEKLEKEIENRNDEIEKLNDKEDYYLKEIDNLKADFEKRKLEILDEGFGLGFTNKPVIKEFK